MLFGQEMTYSALTARLSAGAVVKKTLLTKEFPYEAFLAIHKKPPIVMFIVEEDQVFVMTAEMKQSPQPGQAIITLADPVTQPAPPKKPEKSEPVEMAT